jgi:hypothetical protein
MASPINPQPVLQLRASTGTQTSVAASASDGTVLAANANRLSGTIYNDSAAVFYVLFANGTSSTTTFSVKLYTDDYVVIPAGYTGVVKGIWSSATGSARVTEFTN